LLFPLRVRTGPNRGELGWHPLAHHRVLQVLHNPRYAGAFSYGRRHQRRGPDGRTRYLLAPRQDWIALIPDTHAGYLSWEQFEHNQRRLAAGAAAHGQDRRAGPPREGPALLQGLVLCGRCGQRMTVRYQQRGHSLTPIYVCQRTGIQTATPTCQAILGGGIDHAVSQLLLATVSPMALEVALAVADELAARATEADQLRRAQVERARHTAELARRRYLAVDPDNRLVAASLEADWNQALRDHTHAQEDYERQAAQTATLNAEQRAKVLALASDFPALWNDPRTPQRERKRMVRLLLDDVTLLRGQAITVHVRFKGGQSHSLTLPAPLAAPDLRRTPPAVITEIDRLLDDHTDAEVAQALNHSGIASGTGQPFTAGIVCHIRRSHRLVSRKDRLQARGMVGVRELADRLGVCTSTIKQWAAEGRLRSEVFNDKGERLYQTPDTPPFKKIGRPPNHHPRAEVLSHQA
jgi:hypothetical protein